MARVIVVASGKGGVGKTTSTINIGAALNKLGKDVMIVDANLTTPNLGLHLGAPTVPVSLSHVMSGKAKLHEAIYEHNSGLKILPSSISIYASKIEPIKILELSKKLKKYADMIIFDSAAGLGEDVEKTLQAADDIIIVTQAEIPALTDALKTIKLAESLDKNITGVVITRFKKKDHEIPLENIESMLEKEIIAVIPEDEAVKHALRMRDAVVHTHPNSDAAKGYRELAAKLIGQHYLFELEKQEKKGRFFMILRKIGLA
jgi:septum site-determining protein MinD